MILQLFFSEQLGQAAGPEGSKRIRELEERSLNFVRTCVQEAAEKGMLKPGLNQQHVLLIIFGSIMAAVNLHLHQDFDLVKTMQQGKHDLWHTIENLIRR